MNRKLEIAKLRASIKRSGTDIIFKRKTLNEYKEVTDTENEIGIIKGLYHEKSSYSPLSVSESSQNSRSVTPMITCVYEDILPIGLILGDIVYCNGNKYTINEVVNTLGLSIAAGMSLELLDE